LNKARSDQKAESDSIHLPESEELQGKHSGREDGEVQEEALQMALQEFLEEMVGRH
jgi:hypothetical protein